MENKELLNKVQSELKSKKKNDCGCGMQEQAQSNARITDIAQHHDIDTFRMMTNKCSKYGRNTPEFEECIKGKGRDSQMLPESNVEELKQEVYENVVATLLESQLDEQTAQRKLFNMVADALGDPKRRQEMENLVTSGRKVTGAAAEAGFDAAQMRGGLNIRDILAKEASTRGTPKPDELAAIQRFIAKSVVDPKVDLTDPAIVRSKADEVIGAMKPSKTDKAAAGRHGREDTVDATADLDPEGPLPSASTQTKPKTIRDRIIDRAERIPFIQRTADRKAKFDADVADRVQEMDPDAANDAMDLARDLKVDRKASQKVVQQRVAAQKTNPITGPLGRVVQPLTGQGVPQVAKTPVQKGYQFVVGSPRFSKDPKTGQRRIDPDLFKGTGFDAEDLVGAPRKDMGLEGDARSLGRKATDFIMGTPVEHEKSRGIISSLPRTALRRGALMTIPELIRYGVVAQGGEENRKKAKENWIDDQILTRGPGLGFKPSDIVNLVGSGFDKPETWDELMAAPVLPNSATPRGTRREIMKLIGLDTPYTSAENRRNAERLKLGESILNENDERDQLQSISNDPNMSEAQREAAKKRLEEIDQEGQNGEKEPGLQVKARERAEKLQRELAAQAQSGIQGVQDRIQGLEDTVGGLSIDYDKIKDIMPQMPDFDKIVSGAEAEMERMKDAAVQKATNIATDPYAYVIKPIADIAIKTMTGNKGSADDLAVGGKLASGIRQGLIEPDMGKKGGSKFTQAVGAYYDKVAGKNSSYGMMKPPKGVTRRPKFESTVNRQPSLEEQAGMFMTEYSGGEAAPQKPVSPRLGVRAQKEAHKSRVQVELTNRARARRGMSPLDASDIQGTVENKKRFDIRTAQDDLSDRREQDATAQAKAEAKAEKKAARKAARKAEKEGKGSSPAEGDTQASAGFGTGPSTGQTSPEMAAIAGIPNRPVMASGTKSPTPGVAAAFGQGRFA